MVAMGMLPFACCHVVTILFVSICGAACFAHFWNIMGSGGAIRTKESIFFRDRTQALVVPVGSFSAISICCLGRVPFLAGWPALVDPFSGVRPGLE